MSPYSQHSNNSSNCDLQPEFSKMPVKFAKTSVRCFSPSVASSPFLTPAEFYKNLFASAVLHHSSSLNEAASAQHLLHENDDAATNRLQHIPSTSGVEHMNEIRHFKLHHVPVAAAATRVANSLGSNSFSRNFILPQTSTSTSATAAAAAAAAHPLATEDKTRKLSHSNEKKVKVKLNSCLFFYRFY